MLGDRVRGNCQQSRVDVDSELVAIACSLEYEAKAPPAEPPFTLIVVRKTLTLTLTLTLPPAKPPSTLIVLRNWVRVRVRVRVRVTSCIAAVDIDRAPEERMDEPVRVIGIHMNIISSINIYAHTNIKHVGGCCYCYCYYKRSDPVGSKIIKGRKKTVAHDEAAALVSLTLTLTLTLTHDEAAALLSFPN
jgi:hypothetical protein